jgi:hypothetical protein
MKKLLFFENLNLLRNNDKMGFEPTYEGLKHSLPIAPQTLETHGFEPTYEGLKRIGKQRD